LVLYLPLLPITAPVFDLPWSHTENMGRRSIIIALFLFSVARGQTPQQVEGSQPRLWNGNLLDADKAACSVEVAGAVPKGACPVSVRTTEFALMLPDGRLLKFDEGGNQKAVDALKKSRSGSKAVFDYWKSGKTSKQISARAMGTLTSDVLNVESVRID
jgi:hypothetical protein